MRLRHYLFPHKRNGYKPHVFRATSVTVIALALMVLEGAYLAQIDFIFPKTNFLGAVLPGALVSLTNEDRIANDVPAVTQNPLLTQAAQDAANDMAAKGYFAHISPSGVTPWDWLTQVGYSYQYAGENLAVNFIDSSAVESAWMASPEHHANIVKPQYTQIGVGVAQGMYQDKEATFVVQFFGSPEIASAQPEKVVAIANAPNLPTETKTAAPMTKVLGAQVSTATSSMPSLVSISSSIKNLLAFISTSPNFTTNNILVGLAIVILALLIIAIVVKVTVQFIEIIAGGIILLAIICGFLFFNAKSIPQMQILSNTISEMRSISGFK
jgi:hypothetical protein